MLKIQSDNQVYVVDRGGVLRWIAAEPVAVALYGANWNQMVDDISSAFFVNYRLGGPVSSSDDYNKEAAKNSASDINTDKSL